MTVYDVGSSICGDEHDICRGWIRQAVTADGADIERLCHRGSALDRERCDMHAQPVPPAPMVRLLRHARPPLRRVVPPREPSI